MIIPGPEMSVNGSEPRRRAEFCGLAGSESLGLASQRRRLAELRAAPIDGAMLETVLQSGKDDFVPRPTEVLVGLVPLAA